MILNRACALARRALVVGAVLLGVAGAASGQPASGNPLDPQPNGVRRSDPAHHVLVGATVHAAPGRTIEKAAVEFRDGRIVAVTDTAGGGYQPPAGARVWDAAGLHVYPGFIDAYVEVEAPRVDLNAPGSHWSPMVQPQRSALDGAGLPDSAAEELRKLGFVAAGLSPMNPSEGGGAGGRRGGGGGGAATRTGGIFRGQSAVVSLAKPSGDRSDGRPPVYRERAYQSVAFELADGDREGDTNWRGYPNSQMGAIALIRQTLSDADWQALSIKSGMPTGPTALDAIMQAGTAGDAKQPLYLFNTDDELEARRAAKIAGEFSRNLALLGCGTEFRRLADIADIKAPYILPLNFPKTPEVASLAKAESIDLRELMTWEQAPTNPRRLDAAGISVSLTTSKLRSKGEFKANLASAIRHGLAPDRALAMLTTNPAALLGVSDQLGTIEPGKRASFVVATGDLLTPPAKKSDAKDEKTAGAAPTDAPPAGAGAGKPAGKPKILDVWIDGRRHEIAPVPEAAFEGDWLVTLNPGTPREMKDVATMTFTEALPPKVTITSKNDKGKPVSLTGRNVVAQGRVVTLVFDHDDFGEPGVASLSCVFEAGRTAAATDLIRGTGALPSGTPFTFTAVRKTPSAFEGTWRVTMLDGVEKPAPEGGKNKDQVTLKFRDDALTVTFTDAEGKATPIEATNVVISGTTATFEHDLKPLGAEGVSKDSVTINPEDATALTGTGVMPDGSTHTYAAKKQPARGRGGDDEKDEADDEAAIAAIPEKLGQPFGPYMRDGAPERAAALVLTNATVWTANANNDVIENGVVVVRDGKIAYAGPGAGAPSVPGAEVVKLPDGSHITPGIIDCHSHTGISRGVNESGQAVTAEVRIQDVTDPDAISWYRQLAGGVTAVNNLHGSANPIGGQNCVNKVRWGVIRADEMHFDGVSTYSDANNVASERKSAIVNGIKFALGENVKQSNWGERFTTRYPQTRMGVEAIIQDRFTAAREYIAAWKAWRQNTSALPPRRDLELEALAEILEGHRLVHCHSYRQDEILMLARLAKGFGFKIGTYQHILEGYKVADAIREQAIGASAFSDWWGFKVEVQDAIPAAGPIMWEEGVNVSYNSDSDELARRMNTEAAKAVRYSDPKRPISKAEALKFVTYNPAKQLGIESRVGSLESGKDADIAVWSAEPLSIYAKCVATYVDGRRYFSLEEDAAARAANAVERTRLIQKVLAKDSKKKGSRGKDEGSEDKPGSKPDGKDEVVDGPSPTRPAVTDAQRAYYLRLMQRGMDPMAVRAGECGLCDAVNAN